MITYTKARSGDDLKGILALQQANLKTNLSPVEIEQQGFVTVVHTYKQLSDLNDREQHIIAKEGDKVIGYLLAMTPQSRSEIPALIPMFELFDSLVYENKMISDYQYIVIGQVCIDKHYRGQGLLDICYATYRQYYSTKYDFVVTEIAASNTRSLRAHKRIGFKEIKTYTSDNIAWVVVIWDWQPAI